MFDLFINACQLSLAFLILFQKLFLAARSGNVDLAQDCLQKGADVHYEDSASVSIYIVVYIAHILRSLN